MKRISCLILSIAILCSMDVYSQIKFNKVFGTFKENGEYYDDMGMSIIQIPDEGFVIMGESSQNISLIKTDFYGDTIWTRRYGDELYQTGCDFLKTDDNGFLIVGTNSESSISQEHKVYLVKTNSNGDTLWTKTINDFIARYSNSYPPFRRGFSIAKANNSGYVLAGNIKDSMRSQIILFKIDVSGNVLWTNIFSSVYLGLAHSLKSTNDGGYIVTGKWYATADTYYAYLLKINADGDSLWMKTYLPMTNGADVIQTDDGGYLLVGSGSKSGSTEQDALLIKTNASGDSSWTRFISMSNFNDGILDVIQTNDNGYITGGYYDGNFSRQGNSKMCVMKTDQQGNISWVRPFDYTGDGARCNSLLETENSGFIILGQIGLLVNNYYPPAYNLEIWLISVDKYGCFYPSPVISGNSYFCENDSAFLDAGEGFLTYEWSNGENTRKIYIKEPVDYFVNATDSSGCLNRSDTITVQELPLPDISVSPDEPTILCSGESVNLLAIIHNYDAGKTYSYNWNNDFATTSTINVDTSGKYLVKVEDNYKCKALDSLNVTVRYPYQEEKICIVTVDLLSGKNIIVWENTPDAGIESYNIYRESTIGRYELLGSREAGALSIFRDETANTKMRSYVYKITVVDTCGNESFLTRTPYHWPSFLQYQSSEGGINLSWTEYKIEGVDNIGDYLTSYVIYRGNDSTGLSEYQVVGRQLNFMDNDPNVFLRKYYYRVAGVLKDPCYPTGTAGKKADSGPYSHSMSNIEDNRFQVGIKDNYPSESGLIINPNPFNESAILHFNNPDKSQYKLYIMDLSGKVYQIVDNITSSEYVLQKGDLTEGFYFIELRGSNIYRGKIVIE